MTEPASLSASTAPTTVLLVRHGITPTTGQVLPGRAPGLHLAPQGHEQAAAVAEQLSGRKITAVYSSPLERTQETAWPTAEKFDLVPLLDDGLLECEFGEWTGAKLTELAKLPEWQTVQNEPSAFRFPGGESFPEMQERIVAAVEAIAGRHPNRTVACFSHADPIKAALAHFGGTALDKFQSIAVDPASISVVHIHADGTSDVVKANVRDL